MRMITALLLFFAATAVTAQSTPAQSTPAQTIDAGRGEIALTVPAAYTSDTPAPLIVLLHGYGSSGAGQDGYMKFSALADRYGFLLVTPDGTEEPAGQKNRFWNASEACCNFFASELDDSAYVLSIINTVKAKYSIDERRVYLIGHSNGGFMSYKAAHDHSGVIAALVSLAGAEATDPMPAPANPVHVLQIHGTADGTIAYAGSEIRGNIYPGAVETVERWAAYNGCAPEGRVTGTLDLEKQLDGLETTIVRYTQDCQPGGSGELWTIAEGSHIPAISDVFSEKVVEWLLAHPKVAATSATTAD